MSTDFHLNDYEKMKNKNLLGSKQKKKHSQ